MENVNENIEEKRVTKTVIRRRARKKPALEEKAVPTGEEIAAVEGAPAEAKAEATLEPGAEAPVSPEAAPPAEEVTEQVEAAPKEEISTEIQEEPDEKKVSKKAPKKPVKRRSRADLLMEEYKKAGGLQAVARMSAAGAEETLPVEHMDRVFQPERQQRRGKRVVGHKDFRKTEVTTPSARKRNIKIHQEISVSDLAIMMSIKGAHVVKQLMSMGTTASLNQTIDFETAALVAHEFGYEAEDVSFREEEFIPSESEASDSGEHQEPRSPIVTVMGHVDHGKTSLLDHIRKTKVAAGEAGGITQHIGAYEIETPKGKISFIDTPGHEAFTSMRARGAQVTDIVVLVVAADDGVKPQTVEAINHAKAAKVPIIVAINKIDKPGINIDTLKGQLAEHGLSPEDWGGDTITAPISALTGEGVDSLLEMILLQTELLELKANPDKPATGFILEARLDQGRGPVVTIVIKDGTLNKGDSIVAGTYGGRVRAMFDSAGTALQSARPSMPVEVLGLDGVPEAGDALYVLKSDEDVKKIRGHRKEEVKKQKIAGQTKVSLEDLFARMQEGEKTELKVVLKADVQGSLEALQESLLRLSTDKVSLYVLHGSVGAVTESDVMLAEASQAMIIGFNVRPDINGRKTAERLGISIKTYRVIYEIIDDIKKAMEGLLAPILEEEYLGRAEVRDVFTVSKVGTIAGTSVVDGKVIRGANVRLLRDGTVIHEGKMSSLRRFKEDAKEVAQGYECGIAIEAYNDIKVGDVLEIYRIKEIADRL